MIPALTSIPTLWQIYLYTMCEEALHSMYPSAEDDLEGTHFDREELCRALTKRKRRFTVLERRRALLHFGRGCPFCWRSLTELAELAPWTGPVEPTERVSPAEIGAPVDRALRRCLGFRSIREAEDTGLVLELRPTHRHVLVLACTEADAAEKILAFRRLVLEECRDLVLEDSSQLVVRLERAVKELRDPDLAKLLEDRLRAQEALGLAYLADDHRVAGRRQEARAKLLRAKALLDTCPRDREIHATYYELEADLAVTEGDYLQTLDSLYLAEEMLAGCGIPGRRAVTRLRLGLARSRFADPEGAIGEFRAALREMPPGIRPRLRLDALHHMAVAQVRCGRFAEARRTLEDAAWLYARHAPGSMQAERAWLWGVVHLGASETVPAERKLRMALTLFDSQERVIDAAQTLIDLGRLYKLLGNHDGLAWATLRFVALTNRPEVREMSLENRLAILRYARQCELDLDPRIRRALGEGESEGDGTGEVVN